MLNKSQSTASLLRLATYASVVTAMTLIAAKFLAWLVTGSVSVLASLIDSLMDAAASLINLFAVRYSLMPADGEHRFGHGKAESLAGLAQATFIAGSAVFLILHATERLQHPRALQNVSVAIGVMAFSVIATLVLVGIQRYVIQRTGSTAIRADSLHYMSDLLTNVSIIVALVLAVYGWPGLDPVFAIGVALFILYSAWHIGFEAFHQLMDRELSTEVRDHVQQIALSHPQVLGVHDLRTRQSGQTQIIQLHVELNANLPLAKAHTITDEVDAAIREAFPDADIIIHQDPVPSAERSECQQGSGVQ
jgi:ferrous-iron efflux pump FieF